MGDDGEVTQFSIQHWVRIMSDDGCDGLWDKEGCAVSIEELPVADSIKQKILDWQLEYNCLWDLYQEVKIADWPASNWHAFSVEGLELANSVKEKLPEWTVVYFDEEQYAECCTDTPIKPNPRSYYEFEIMLSGKGCTP